MTSTPSPSKQLKKWKAPLLLIVLSLFIFESLSGFILFFFERFLGSIAQLTAAHWIIGLITLLPYTLYQWRHYLSVRSFSSQFHYKIGLLTFITVVIVMLSGFPLLLDLNRDTVLFTVIDLTHVVSSFAFLILLSGHLVLVARLTIARENKKAPVKTGASAVIGKRAFWIPFAIAIGSLLIITFL